jgi:hypothetical protein
MLDDTDAVAISADHVRAGLEREIGDRVAGTHCGEHRCRARGSVFLAPDRLGHGAEISVRDG